MVSCCRKELQHLVHTYHSHHPRKDHPDTSTSSTSTSTTSTGEPPLMHPCNVWHSLLTTIHSLDHQHHHHRRSSSSSSFFVAVVLLSLMGLTVLLSQNGKTIQLQLRYSATTTTINSISSQIPLILEEEEEEYHLVRQLVSQSSTWLVVHLLRVSHHSPSYRILCDC